MVGALREVVLLVACYALDIEPLGIRDARLAVAVDGVVNCALVVFAEDIDVDGVRADEKFVRNL